MTLIIRQNEKVSGSKLKIKMVSPSKRNPFDLFHPLNPCSILLLACPIQVLIVLPKIVLLFLTKQIFPFSADSTIPTIEKAPSRRRDRYDFSS